MKNLAKKILFTFLLISVFSVEIFSENPPLEEKGFIYKDPDNHRYYMTPKVKALSDGYSDDDQLANLSRPHLLNVTEILRWPVALAVISGVDLILRDNTDNVSPLAIEHFSNGYPVPILGCASGAVATGEPMNGRPCLTAVGVKTYGNDKHIVIEFSHFI